MKKLTLVSFYWNGMKVSAFVMALFINNKASISKDIIDSLFLEHFGKCPLTGDTISVG